MLPVDMIILLAINAVLRTNVGACFIHRHTQQQGYESVALYSPQQKN
jgi:hypothetical protein